VGIFEPDDDAATPLAHEERSGLIPSWVSFRHELNEIEQSNIAKATLWAFRRRHRGLLDERFLKDLHKRMFGEVWRWAGTFRTTERNIGIDPWRIGTEVRNLIGDASLWEEQSVYDPHETAIRFHHRLVFIHPFPNGNGRHARLMADLLVARSGSARLTWGSAGFAAAGTVRAAYIEALRAADRHDIEPLLNFARS
jgi:Fic-DOC domain mobile mystery protein B